MEREDPKGHTVEGQAQAEAQSEKMTERDDHYLQPPRGNPNHILDTVRSSSVKYKGINVNKLIKANSLLDTYQASHVRGVSGRAAKNQGPTQSEQKHHCVCMCMRLVGHELCFFSNSIHFKDCDPLD